MINNPQSMESVVDLGEMADGRGLPFEVIRRIIAHRLSLPPSYPSALSASDPITPAWDGLAGQCSRQSIIKRRRERRDVQEAALDLMRVCKAWKPLVLKYLYTEPAIDAFNFMTFTRSLVNGDKKWSDLNLHPHSIPGRYVTTLDLSHLDEGYPMLHITTVNAALRSIFPLVPNLRHLILPFHSPLTLEDLWRAPFARRLRALEALSISTPTHSSVNRVNPFIRVIQGLPNLEFLSIFGAGNADIPTVPEEALPTLDLKRLHTLLLNGVKCGPLMDALILSELPALRRLLITSYHDAVNDRTHAFQVAHGDKILSLTYTHNNEWPMMDATPPSGTLDLHPSLVHLSYSIPNSLLQSSHDLAIGLQEKQFRDGYRYHRPHPLKAITVPKWTSNRNVSPSPSAIPTPTTAQANGHDIHQMGLVSLSVPVPTRPSGNRFLRILLESPPSNLKRITIDGFKWTRPDLTWRALNTGDSGAMRQWATELSVRGLGMRDMEGKEAPVLPESVSMGLEGRSRGPRRGSSQTAALSASPKYWDWDRDRGGEDGS